MGLAKWTHILSISKRLHTEDGRGKGALQVFFHVEIQCFCAKKTGFVMKKN